MIVNTFTFNGQYELLDVHISYMYDKVDKFLIVQANRTFSGYQKQVQYYNQNINKYIDNAYLDKIEIIKFDAYSYMKARNMKPYTFLRYRDITSWHIQNATKTQWLQHAKNTYEQNPDQQLIYIVSDLDEIPNMENFEKVKNIFKQGHPIIGLDGVPFYKGKFNALASIKEGVYLKYVDMKQLISKGLVINLDWEYGFNQHLHSLGVVKNMPFVIDGTDMGWHFSCVMVDSQIIRKQHDLSHIIDNVIQNNDSNTYSGDICKLNFAHKLIQLNKMKIPQKLRDAISKYPYLIG